MRIRDRLLKGTALNLIAVVFSQGSTLVANIIVARLLLKQGFGEYAMVQTTLLTLVVLSQLATGSAAARYIAEYRVKDPLRAGCVMGLCALVSVIMAGSGAILIIIISPWLADVMLNAPHLADALIIGAGFIFFSAINGYQMGALSGLEAFGSLAKAGVVSGIFAIVAISFCAWYGGLNGALLGLSISAFVRCAVHYWWLKLESHVAGIKLQYSGSMRQEKVVICKFMLPVAIAQFYSPPMIWLASSFLVRQPDGYGEMALYSAANSLRILVLFLPSVLNNVGLSVLNNELAKGNTLNYHRVFKSNVLYIFLSSLCGILIIGFLGRPLLQIFGRDFVSGNAILWFLLISSLFEALTIAFYQYIIAKVKMWIQFIGIVVPREALLVAAAYCFVPLYGGLGLAIAFMGAAVLGAILHLLLVVSLYKKSIQYSEGLE